MLHQGLQHLDASSGLEAQVAGGPFPAPDGLEFPDRLLKVPLGFVAVGETVVRVSPPTRVALKLVLEFQIFPYRAFEVSEFEVALRNRVLDG